MRLKLLLAACWLAAAPPLTAQQAPAAVPEVAAATIAIPFNPPLDEPLLYRFTVDETRNGQPIRTSLDLRVTFSRDATGPVITVAYLLPAGMSASHPAIAVLTRPVSLRLGDRAEIIGMVDEDGYWAALEGIMGGLARQAGGDDPEAARMMAGLLAQMRALPLESRLALITRNFSALIEFSGAEMRQGEVVEETLEGESVFGPVVQEVSTSLTEVSASEARIQATYRLAPGQLEGIMRNLQERFGRAPPAGQAEALNEVNVTRRDSFRVSLRTGLTEHHESVITFEGEIDGEQGRARKTQRLFRIP